MTQWDMLSPGSQPSCLWIPAGEEQKKSGMASISAVCLWLWGHQNWSLRGKKKILDSFSLVQQVNFFVSISNILYFNLEWASSKGQCPWTVAFWLQRAIQWSREVNRRSWDNLFSCFILRFVKEVRFQKEMICLSSWLMIRCQKSLLILSNHIYRPSPQKPVLNQVLQIFQQCSHHYSTWIHCLFLSFRLSKHWSLLRELGLCLICWWRFSAIQ